MSKPPRIVIPANEILVEVEGLLRSLPSAEELASDDDIILAWRGKAIATITAWSITKGNQLSSLFEKIDGDFMFGDKPAAIRQIRLLLHEARQAQILQVGPAVGSTAIPAGSVFQYFTELTKRLQLASRDVFFVDPYLEATFAERYLPQIQPGVTTRLLTSSKQIPKLVPAVDMFVKQHSALVLVREATFHDRFVFIDGSAGFQSGASFKDGAVKAPTGLIEIVDTLPAMLQQYEQMWAAGTVHR